MNKGYINEIINKKFNTDKGYLYFCDLIKEKYPSFKINEENINNIIIEELTQEEFIETQFVGVYTAKNNTIKVFTNRDKNNEKIYDEIDLTDDELINTFLHELIHCMTSKVNEDMILEGINMRMPDGQSSYFLGINEGITQMITDDLLETKSDAYIFQTIFAKQLAEILGKDKLLEMYSNNQNNEFIESIMQIDPNFDIQSFVINSYYFNALVNGTNIPEARQIGTEIQLDLLNLQAKTNTKNENFDSLVLTKEKVLELSANLPYIVISLRDCGFSNIEQLDMLKEKNKEI